MLESAIQRASESSEKSKQEKHLRRNQLHEGLTAQSTAVLSDRVCFTAELIVKVRAAALEDMDAFHMSCNNAQAEGPIRAKMQILNNADKGTQ